MRTVASGAADNNDTGGKAKEPPSRGNAQRKDEQLTKLYCVLAYWIIVAPTDSATWTEAQRAARQRLTHRRCGRR